MSISPFLSNGVLAYKVISCLRNTSYIRRNKKLKQTHSQGNKQATSRSTHQRVKFPICFADVSNLAFQCNLNVCDRTKMVNAKKVTLKSYLLNKGSLKNNPCIFGFSLQ